MKAFLFCSLLLIASGVFAQDAIRDSANTLLRQGDFDNAVAVLKSGLKQDPSNTQLNKDLAFAYYLARDYAHAIELCKQLTAKPDADIMSYQVLGLNYKAIADYANAEKMYKEALIKFPNSGILYSEYGDFMQMNNNAAEAIKLWEKGIELDPNNSSNYYYAAKYYAEHNKPLWAVLYGETFLNIESLTQRTTEIKKIVTDNYTTLFTPGVFASIARNGNDFEKSVSSLLNNFAGIVANGITPESATTLRTKFIIEWYDHYASKYPYRLFDHQKFLLQKNMFDAYNQWVFSTPAAYNDWATAHAQQADAFKNYQRSIVYKIPAGQYYAVM